MAADPPPLVDQHESEAQNPDMAVDKRALGHFRAIAEAMAAKSREDCLEAVASSPAERVRTGFLLGDVPRTPAIEAELDARARGQIGLALRRPVRWQ